jgi:hypothetical protein
MTIQQGETHIVYNDFDLDTKSGFSLPYLNEEIVRIGLVDNSYEIIQAQSSGAFGNPVEQLVSELINYDDIDYDLCSDLLFKLSEQAVAAVQSQLSADADITRVIHQFKKILGQRIHEQIVKNITLESEGFAIPIILPFVEILPQHMTETEGYGRKDYREIISPKSLCMKDINMNLHSKHQTVLLKASLRTTSKKWSLPPHASLAMCPTTTIVSFIWEKVEADLSIRTHRHATAKAHSALLTAMRI